MADDYYNIKTFTAADIEKYHKGQLSAREMHAIEKAALDDPFLADALEGYTVSGVNVSADIAELKRRLAGEKEETKVIPIYGAGRSSFPWLRVAVLLVLIAGAGLLSYQFLFKPDSNQIAEAPLQKDSLVKPEETAKAQPPVSNQDTAPVISLPANESTTELSSLTRSKKTELITNKPAIAIVSDAKQKAAELPQAQKDVVANTDDRKLELAAATAPPKVEEKAIAETKDLRNSTAYNKSIVVPKPDQPKAKEFESGVKEGVAADKVLDFTENVTVVGYGTKKMENQQSAFRQNATPNIFRGRITDANNNPLPFANVTNTTDNVGTYTDAKGHFALISPDSIMEVQVRSLGFENNKIRLHSGENTNQVTLQEDRALTARILDTVKRNYARARDGNLTFEEPEPADGWASYDSYLFNNQNDIPEAYTVKKNTGTDVVELSFEVNKNGDPVNIKVEKSLCAKCDKEAIRLIKEGPKWKRKSKKGKRTTVKVPFMKPVDW